MLRGSSSLLDANLDFFDDLVARLFEGSAVPAGFWDLRLQDFAEGSKRQSQATEQFDEALGALRAFQGDGVSWTDTLATKVLLGLWGHTPAFDVYFKRGLGRFLKANPGVKVRDRTAVSGRSLADLADLASSNHWWQRVSYRTKVGGKPYPPGKLIDMAFFQFGADLSSDAP